MLSVLRAGKLKEHATERDAAAHAANITETIGHNKILSQAHM